MEFYSDGQGTVRYEGLSVFNTEERGSYTGNILEEQSTMLSRIIIAKEPTLELFNGKIFNDIIAKYKQISAKFEETTQRELFARLASNIPFGDIAVFDAEFQRSDSFGRRSAQKTIHNYFFLKGLLAASAP